MQFFKYFIFLGLTLMSASCSSNDKYKNAANYNGSTFTNIENMSNKTMFDVLKWKWKSSPAKWPKSLPEPNYVTPARKVDAKMLVTFVTHATFLIQVDGLNILTDPVWSSHVGPVSFLGADAISPPAIKFEDLPPIDLVIISHNHYDHMDSETIKKLEAKFSPLFIVPLANKDKMKKFGAKNIVELNWWESHQFNNDLKVTLAPAKHWSRRSLFDTNKSLWGSFFLTSSEFKIYFAGDTGLGQHFKMINEKLGAPDIALLPIGAYEPRWFMREAHMNPEDAILAHLDLDSQFSIGMHFGTFQLTDEAIDAPEKDLEMAKLKHKVKNFASPTPGQIFEFSPK